MWRRTASGRYRRANDLRGGAKNMVQLRTIGCEIEPRQPAEIYPNRSATTPGGRAGRLGHDVELDQAPLLFLLQVRPALLDVDVVPRQQLGDRPLAVDVEVQVHPEVLDGLPPQVGLEALLPG